MIPDEEVRLTQMSHASGCAAKIGPGMLQEILKGLPMSNDGNLLVGIETNDDGAVYRISQDLAMIQTLDFFPPMVDDPYVFGQVAAANALSDIYAMGGEPKIALNIVAWPNCVNPEILGRILKGGADKVREAGIVLVDYDIDTEAQCDAKVLSDNAAGGAMAADYLVQEMGTEGKVLILTEVPGVTTAEERIAGFKERMAEIAPNVEMVEQLSNGTRDTHRATTENMLQAHPDITGIFCFMGDNSLGAYTACKTNNRQDVLIAGYDATPEQLDIMKNDGPDCNLICSVALYPKKIGYVALETAYNILEGEEINDVVWTELGLLTAKDADSFEAE